MDVMTVTEVQELPTHELRAVVGDDDVGYLESMDNVGEEQDGLLEPDVGDGSSLDPHGKFVDGLTTRCPLEGPHEVEAPDRKQLGDGDHL